MSDPTARKRGPNRQKTRTQPPENTDPTAGPPAPTGFVSQPREATVGASDPSRNGKPPWLDGAVEFVAQQLATVKPHKTYDRRDLTDSIMGFLSGKPVTYPGPYIRECATANALQFEPTPGPSRYQREEAP